MHLFRHFRKSTSIVAILLFSGSMMLPVHAAMVGNDVLIAQAQHEINVHQVISMLDKSEVQKKLTDMGVDPVAAKDRVEQLTDRELTTLLQNIESLPAGGDAGGILLTVFIVLVITDMIGATDVFPFVKNINK